MLFTFIWHIILFILTTSILITIHELGHFVIARYCGIKVKCFSIGFGRTLLRFRDKYDTEYIIAIIPLGGYIKLDDKTTIVMSNHNHEIFDSKSIWQRSIIIIAGPISNILFAILIYWCLFLLGIPSYKPIIGEVIPNSIAAKANILPGMEVKSINGIKTNDWDEVHLELFNHIGSSKITLNVKEHDSFYNKNKILDLSNWQLQYNKEDPIISLGIIPSKSIIQPILGKIKLNSPAMKAGLTIGDRIIKINNCSVNTWQDLVKIIHNNPNILLQLLVEHKGYTKIVNLKPDIQTKKNGTIVGFAGIFPDTYLSYNKLQTIQQYNLFMSLVYSFYKVWRLLYFTMNMLMKLIMGNINLSNISGPISIAQGACVAAKYGLVNYLMFLALMNINLGIVNLLPLPVLDGGYLLLLILEQCLTKSIFEILKKVSYYIGIIILVLLMSLAMLNDLSRLYS